MKAFLIILLLAATLRAQEQPCPGQQPDDDIKALIVRQNELLEKQNALLAQLIPLPPKKHRKVVRVLLKVLPVIDHTGSVASIVSVFGVTLP